MSVSVNGNYKSAAEWGGAESIGIGNNSAEPVSIENRFSAREVAAREISARPARDVFVSRLKRALESGIDNNSLSRKQSATAKWGSVARSKAAEPVKQTVEESPLDIERLRAAAIEITESQERADALLATPEGRAQFTEIRKRILLDQEEEIFGPQGNYPGWEAKQRLIFLEPDRVYQIRMADDDDIINRLPGAKLAHLITDLAGNEDPAAAAQSEEARANLAYTAMRFVQSQPEADQILSTPEGPRAADAMKYLIMRRQEASILGQGSDAFGWEAKMRLIFFKPHEVERIRMLNDQVAVDEYDEIKRARAALEGAQIVSQTRPSESNRGGIVSEFIDLLFSTPGQKVGIFGTTVRDGRGIDDIRRSRFPEEYAIGSDGSSALQSAPFAANPRGEAFDPYQYLPNITFSNGEDSLPVDPVFDGDAWPDNNVLNYAHGTIGGQQPLKAAVNVYQKDGYYVAQYGFYYADNKGGDYHKHDWHTTSVYLKYNAQTGGFEPKYLYNSWHFGGVMTKWSDLQLDAQGRPTVMVELGTHAARPLGRGKQLPYQYSNGLTLRGSDGTAVSTATGYSSGEQLSFFTTQNNIANATVFDPSGDSVERTRAGIYYWWQDHRRNPYSPRLFGLQ